MPDLNFQVESAEPVPYAAAPLLAFKLRLGNTPADETIHTIVLRAQIQLDVTRRHYSAQEQERLLDLFGDSDRWSKTLRNMLWTHASVVVPQFTRETLVDLPVPCSFDFNIASTKYFHGLTEGDLPLIFLSAALCSTRTRPAFYKRLLFPGTRKQNSDFPSGRGSS